MKHVYLCTKSCNRVTTAASWESSSVEYRIVEVTATMTSCMVVEHSNIMGSETVEAHEPYLAVHAHGNFRLPCIAARRWSDDELMIVWLCWMQCTNCIFRSTSILVLAALNKLGEWVSEWISEYVIFFYGLAQQWRLWKKRNLAQQ